jgi:uncharacterized protein involved in outer membrane biogenesis
VIKKILLAVGAGLVVMALVAVVARNQIARVGVQLGVRRVTGFPLTIGSVNVGLAESQLDVRDIKLMNPPGYAEPLFVDLPRLHVDYRLGSMLALAPHINDMLVDINQLVIVRTDKGESNAMKLKGVLSSGKRSTKYRVDQLRVHIGTVRIKDYSHVKPMETVKQLNINATYKDITDSTDITRLVLLTVMGKVRLPEIGIKPEDLTKNLGNVRTMAEGIIKGAAGTLEKSGEGLLDAVKESTPK